ncbi:MAG: geranylgeranylglycerol-phosphate geranylgeranyltransferase [Candidatus Zixiibacteriota bacterium]|nr:MAG: geranylgeranylglycerol-phosphate geranylgeranyltransferase [candidate division Zixibacteria bacterium]
MRTVISLIRLIRLHNTLMAAAGVWLGGYLSGLTGEEHALFLGSLSAALVCGAGNALNDYLDIEVDRLNHPRRPLPSGQLAPYQALLAALLLNLAAVVLAVAVGPAFFMLILGAAILLLVYNIRLRKTPIWGNLVVSVLAGLTFVAGALIDRPEALAELPGPLVPALYAFLFHFGRELVKDIADYHGDKTAGYRTLPSVFSIRAIQVLVAVVYLVLLVLAITPVFMEWYSHTYAYIVILVIGIPLAGVVGFIFLSERPLRFAYSSRVLKVLMLFGLIAFLASKKQIL